MDYCPQNIWWIQYGLTQCFLGTIAPSIMAALLLFTGGPELRMYRKYGTRLPESSLRRSCLYNLQIALSFFMPILAIVRFILQATVYSDGIVYGYMIVYLILTILSFLLSVVLIHVERHCLLPAVPPQGHGFVLLLFWGLAAINENLSLINFYKEGWWFQLHSLTDKIEMGLFVIRYLVCVLLLILGLKAPGIMKLVDYYSDVHPESLLGGSDQTPHEGSTFRNGWKKMKILLPFMWPENDKILQGKVVFCIVLLIGGRVINLYVPLYSKLIVDSMTGEASDFRWDLVLMYVLFKFLQGGGTGGMGLLNNLRSFLWIGIQQYTTREIELNLFTHLHSLSLRWHLSRKTGEVLRVMDRGTDSIFNLLNYILFSILPTLTDILIAVIYFISAFNGWFGLIVLTTMVLYILATVMITEWRTKFQRKMNLADNAQKARSVDSLLNFETVKYYGAEEYEVNCYRTAILEFQTEEWKSMITMNILSTVQNFIVCAGLMAGSLLCVYIVVNGNGLTVGDYVLFASYIIQLYVPLNWFGTYYRQIQKNFINMENMFDLLREKQEVRDIVGAAILDVRQGHVNFRNVSFGYIPEKTVLKNITFYASPEHTVALVGPSGSGKSTIIRLLFRFYDVNSGFITIDGHNISKVTQQSLRQAIGVVPQDTVLFNNTIEYNISYGSVESSDIQSVIEAAEAADIHDRIMNNFPDGYDTQVGERGLKLSGGEKQRVAIARTILKAPSVVLLDEATSALDTLAERQIQKAIADLSPKVTKIIVAHRLSTIIHCDEILVLNEGEIIERGSHNFLLAQGGMYFRMWERQLRAEGGDIEMEGDHLLASTSNTPTVDIVNGVNIN